MCNDELAKSLCFCKSYSTPYRTALIDPFFHKSSAQGFLALFWGVRQMILGCSQTSFVREENAMVCCFCLIGQPFHILWPTFASLQTMISNCLSLLECSNLIKKPISSVEMIFELSLIAEGDLRMCYTRKTLLCKQLSTKRISHLKSKTQISVLNSQRGDGNTIYKVWIWQVCLDCY